MTAAERIAKCLPHKQWAPETGLVLTNLPLVYSFVHAVLTICCFFQMEILIPLNELR